jgi:tetratricopeptide (TPR) repeat protein
MALTLALAAAGCASTVGQRQEGYPQPSAPPPVQPPPPLPPAPRPPPRDPSTSDGAPVAIAPPVKALPDYPREAEAISGQAVVSLMKQARAARAAGNHDQASAVLERALRIEPRNYFVWSALGRVYLDKKLFDDAESVALKSNSLARGNVYVELENWKVIAGAREGQGNAIGALQAQTKVDEIQRSLAGG